MIRQRPVDGDNRDVVVAVCDSSYLDRRSLPTLAHCVRRRLTVSEQVYL